MYRLPTAAILALALASCTGQESSVPAQPIQANANATATATVGDATLHASTMDVADLNETVAKRYAIERGSSGVLLLVTVRDSAGNGIAPGDLLLDSTAGALLDTSKQLSMRAITTNGMTDYIGVFKVSPPATVQFRISAVRNGARAEMSMTAELYPR